MMRPVSLVVPPKTPDGLGATLVSIAKNGKTGTVHLAWNDNSIADTAYVVQRRIGTGAWVNLTTIPIALTQQRNTGPMSYNDTTWTPSGVYEYRIAALNTVGYGGSFPSMTAQSLSAAVGVSIPPPTALSASLQSGPQVRLSWTDNALNETGFVVQRSANGGAFAQIGTAPAKTNTGSVTFTDTGVSQGSTYDYRVAAVNAVGQSSWSNTFTILVAAPAAPTINTAAAVRQGGNERVTVTWGAVTGATGYTIQWSATSAFTTVAGSGTVGGVTTFTTGNIARQIWYFRVIATNPLGPSPPSPIKSVPSA